MRLVGRLAEIEQSTQKRLEKNPHADDFADAAVVVMLFENLRAAEQAERARRDGDR